MKNKVSHLNIPENIKSSAMAYLKYVYKFNVEHLVSVLKNILAPNRKSFKFKHI